MYIYFILTTIIILIILYCTRDTTVTTTQEIAPKKEAYSKNYTIEQSIEELQKDCKSIDLQTLSSKTIYRNGTFHDNIIDKVRLLIQPYICKINKLSNTHNSINEIDIIILEIDKQGTEKYTIDFFIYNNHKYINTRILLKIIKQKDNIFLTNIQLANAELLRTTFSDKDTHNINTNNILSSTNDKDSLPYLTGYDNNYSYTKLEKSIVHYPNKSYFQENAREANKWIESYEIKNIDSDVFPSRKIYNCWDEKGIQLTDILENKDNGVNSATVKRKVVGNFNPTLIGLPRDNLGLHQLFDLSVGIPSFPTGNSIGSGSK